MAVKPVDIRQLTELLEQKLVDDGKLMEAGFRALQVYFIPKSASQDQINDMRMAYFAGAQHLWSSVMGILDPGEEPTEKDMRRMSNINDELSAWTNEMTRKERGPAN